MEIGPGNQVPTRQDAPLLNRPITTNGLPSGNLQMLGNGTPLSPVDYWVEALEGECLSVARFVIYVAASSQNLIVGGYGDLPTLINGIQIFYYLRGVLLDVTNGLPITSHDQWARWNYDATPIGPYGANNKTPFFAIRWTFIKYGTPWGLVLNEGDKVGIRLNDDLSGLLEHTCISEGVHLGRPSPLWTQILPTF